MKELKAELAERNISFPANAKKAKLVELLLSEMKPVVVTPQVEPKMDLAKLTVKMLKAQLLERGISFPSNAKKAVLVDLVLSSKPTTKKIDPKKDIFVSSEAAAAEKAVAGESLAVEHIAELAPGQARKARAAKRKPIVPDICSSAKIDDSNEVPTTKAWRSKRKRKA